jgi:hypothetical protein
MNLSKQGFRSGRGVLLAGTLMLASVAVSAGPITGTFGFDGPGVLAFSASGDFIDFCSSVTGSTCNNNGSGTGDFTVTGPGTGSFAALTNTTAGTIDDLTDVTPPAAGYTYLPPGVAVSINDIIELAGFSTWDFQADILPLASCTTTATQQCLGPFQLNQNGSNVGVEMNVYGTLINMADGSRSTMDIAITGNYLGTTIGAVEAGAESAAGAFSDNWSASVTATAPEPGTSSMMLLAGAGLFLLSRFRRSKTNR